MLQLRLLLLSLGAAEISSHTRMRVGSIFTTREWRAERSLKKVEISNRYGSSNLKALNPISAPALDFLN